MAASVIYMRKHGIKSVKPLGDFIRKSADEKRDLQDTKSIWVRM